MAALFRKVKVFKRVWKKPEDGGTPPTGSMVSEFVGIARFHEFVVELDEGQSHTCAIIEWDDGKLETPLVRDIQFEGEEL